MILDEFDHDRKRRDVTGMVISKYRRIIPRAFCMITIIFRRANYDSIYPGINGIHPNYLQIICFAKHLRLVKGTRLGKGLFVNFAQKTVEAWSCGIFGWMGSSDCFFHRFNHQLATGITTWIPLQNRHNWTSWSTEQHDVHQIHPSGQRQNWKGKHCFLI